MRKTIIILSLLCLQALTAGAKGITASFRGVPLSEALASIASQQKEYRLEFIVSDLEGFKVTVDIVRENVIDAVNEVIGAYPVMVTLQGKNIFVDLVRDGYSNVSGRLVDKNGEAVPYALVTLLNMRDSTRVTGALADEDGTFFITCPTDSFIMRVNAVGFAPLTLAIAPHKMGDIRLERDAMMLEQIEVNASNIVHLREKDIIYITREMRKGSYDTGELLGKVPGMTYNRVTGDLRYQGQTKIIILMDSLEYDASYLKKLHHARFDKIEVTPFPKGKYADYDVLINLCRKEHYEGWEDNGMAHVTLDPTNDGLLKGKHFNEFNAYQCLTYTHDKWNFFTDFEPFTEQEDMNNLSYTTFPLNHYSEQVIDNADGSRNTKVKDWNGNLRGSLDYQFDKHNSASLSYRFYKSKERQWKRNTVVRTELEDDNLTPSAPSDTIGSSSLSSTMAPTHSVAGFYRGQTKAWNYTASLTYSHYTEHTDYDLEKTSGYQNIDNRNTRMDHTFGKLEVNRRFLQDKIYYALGYDDLWKHYLQTRSETGEALSNYALKQSTVWTYGSYNVTDKASLSVLASITTNHTKGDQASDRYLSWVGKLTYFQKMKAEQWMSLYYSCDVSNPDLQRVTSYGYFSDSLSWQSGNPLLRSSVSHWVKARYHFLKCLTMELSDNYQPRTFTNITTLQYGALQDGVTQSYYASTMPQNAKWNKAAASLSFDKKIKALTLSANAQYWHISGKYQDFHHSVNGWECEAYAEYYIEKWDLVCAANYAGGCAYSAWAQGWSKTQYDNLYLLLEKNLLHGKMRISALYLPPLHFTSGRNTSVTSNPATVAHYIGYNRNDRINHHIEVIFSFRLSGGKSVRQYNREMSEER